MHHPVSQKLGEMLLPFHCLIMNVTNFSHLTLSLSETKNKLSRVMWYSHTFPILDSTSFYLYFFFSFFFCSPLVLLFVVVSVFSISAIYVITLSISQWMDIYTGITFVVLSDWITWTDVVVLGKNKNVRFKWSAINQSSNERRSSWSHGE